MDGVAIPSSSSPVNDPTESTSLTSTNAGEHVDELQTALEELNVVDDEEEEHTAVSSSTTETTPAIAVAESHTVTDAAEETHSPLADTSLPVAPAHANPPSSASSVSSSSPPSSASSGTQITMQNAVEYLEQVKKHNSAEVYQQFLEIMKDFKSRSIDTSEVIQRVKTLLRGQSSLLLGFNLFLPQGCRLELDPEDATPILSPSSNAPSSSTSYAPPSHPDPARSGVPNVQDALGYLEQVRNYYRSNPVVYNRFLDVMKDFKMQNIDTQEVILRIKDLFGNNRSLLLGFNQFLPPGFAIEVEPESENESVPEHPAAAAAPVSNPPPIQFRDAIEFVGKIKARFKETPQVYAQFLDVLRSYQTRECTVGEVEQNFQELFSGHPDLIEGFKHFLPQRPQVAQT